MGFHGFQKIVILNKNAMSQMNTDGITLFVVSVQGVPKNQTFSSGLGWAWTRDFKMRTLTCSLYLINSYFLVYTLLNYEHNLKQRLNRRKVNM